MIDDAVRRIDLLECLVAELYPDDEMRDWDNIYHL